MKIAINSLSFQKENIKFYKKLLKLLAKRKAIILLQHKLYDFLSTEINLSKNIESFVKGSQLKNSDFVFSIGGDGTLLNTITYVKDKEIPILGINTGRLGFLAVSTIEKIEESLIALEEKTYKVEERILLRMNSSEDLFKGANFALNDFSILKRDASSMIVVHTYVNGEFLNSYWADGIVVSTPTGSTAYSLSCGGPVIMPQSNNFVISPVCPHNLNVRPIVVPATSKISFKVEGRTEKYQITLDSRNKTIDKSVDISIEKEKFKVKIVTTQEYNYLSTLREKLSWGSDIRN